MILLTPKHTGKKALTKDKIVVFLSLFLVLERLWYSAKRQTEIEIILRKH